MTHSGQTDKVCGTHLAELREHGVTVLRGVFANHVLAHLKRPAEECFSAIDGGHADRYGFTPFSHSVTLAALLDFGLGSVQELLAPFTLEGMNEFLVEALGGLVVCNIKESWLRKRFAPSNAPRRYHPNSWHQDGGLGVAFSADVRLPLAMTRLLTCWIPLRACGSDSPGLEFVRHRLDGLLHYTELDDSQLRQRFPPEEFWAPELQFGDGLVFLNGCLHRTYVRPEMTQDRMSLEYRFFPVTMEV